MMLSIVKILKRCRTSYQNPTSLSSQINCRFQTFTTQNAARYQRGLGNLKKAFDKKMEAKKIYKKEDASCGNPKESGDPDSLGLPSMRSPSDLGKAFAFFAGTAFVTYSCASIIENQNEKRKQQKWINEKISEGRQPVEQGIDETLAALIGLNLAVFLLWRLPALQPFMSKYFTSSFASKNLCSPMLLSTFSHYNSVHLFMNMYALNSFANDPIKFMGKEQFLAFYLTGGVFASFVSLAWKCMTRTLPGSLGASGAIFALIGYFCVKKPDSQIEISTGFEFCPQLTLSGHEAIYGYIAVLVAGLFIPSAKIFDHAAHLGGFLFGIWYAHYGEFWYRQLVPATKKKSAGKKNARKERRKLIEERRNKEDGENEE